MAVVQLLLFCSASLIGVSGKTVSDALHVKRAHYFQPVWDSQGFHVGGGQFSVWRPSTLIQGFYPLGDALSEDPKLEPSGGQSLLVFDAHDGKVKPPVAIRMDSSFGNTKQQRAAGFTFYELVGPPGYRCLGYVASKGHFTYRNLTVQQFQNYRCVHSRYVTVALSVQLHLSIVDHYDPKSSYDRTILWRVKSGLTSPTTESDVSSETFVAAYARDRRTPPRHFYTLNSTSLTFINPLYNSGSPLIVYDTNDLDLVHQYDSISIWNVKKCCTFGHTLTPLAFQVVENPNYVKRNGDVAPLAEPTGFQPVGNHGNVAILKPICPPDYEALGHFIQCCSEYQLKKHARCVHRRHVTYGRWVAINDVGFSRAEAINETTALGMSTFFVSKANESHAPVLRRLDTTVLSGRDVVNITVTSNYETIWQNIEEKLFNKTWLGVTNSNNCNATEGKTLEVTNIIEPLATVVQLAIYRPVESPFRFEFSGFGVFNESPMPFKPQQSFAVQTTTVNDQQLVINRSVRAHHTFEYHLKGVQRNKRSNWTVDAIVDHADGTQQRIKLSGSAVMVTYANVTAKHVDVPCLELSTKVPVMSVQTASSSRSSALPFNWFNLVTLLIFQVRSFVN